MPRSGNEVVRRNAILPWGRLAMGLGLAAMSLGLAAISLIAADGGRCLADAPAGAKPAPGASAPAAAPVSRPDEAERKKVIDSPDWRAMQHELHEWLSVQQVYTPSRLRKVKAELNAKVAKMSPQELVDFMADMDAKLKIMMSPEAEQARLWTEQRLATQVNLTPEQLKQMRPDVLNMTTAQLELTLGEWKQSRQQTIANQQAFVKGRDTEIKNIQAMEKDEERERDDAINRAYEYGNYGGGYGSYYGGRALNNPTWFRGGGGYYGGGGSYGGYRW